MSTTDFWMGIGALALTIVFAAGAIERAISKQTDAIIAWLHRRDMRREGKD